MKGVKLIFIRHAESLYNRAVQKALGSTTTVLKYKEEHRKLKFDETLIDCGLTQEGIDQCHRVAEKYQQIQVDVVLISPLRRAIQTASIIFKYHPSKPKLIVVPYLSEMLSTSCDIGGCLMQTMNEYPQFDYTNVLNSEYLKQYPNMWTLEHLVNLTQKQTIQQYILQAQLQMQNQDLNSTGPELILSYLKKYSEKSLETNKDMKQRVEQAKQELFAFRNQATVCITHWNFIQTITASQFTEQGKPINGMSSENCEEIYFEI